MPRAPRKQEQEPLRVALTALERDDLEAARDALVIAWQARRAPAIAELVDVLEAARPGEVTRSLNKVVEPRIPPSLVNLKRFASVDDPRLATWVLAALRNPPFCSPTSGPFLGYLAKTMVRLADPRLDAVLPTIRKILTARVTRKPIYTTVLAQLDRAVARRPPIAEATAEERALELAVAAKVAPLRGSMVTYESLLAEVYACPNDDAPRLVLADFLLERGDPYGELISLQLARGREGEPPPRELELLKRHGKTWLGNLATVLRWGKSYSDTTFVRGFVAVADFIFKIEKKLPLVASDPGWSTVERLEGHYDRAFLAEAPLRALREIALDARTCALMHDRDEPFASVTTVRFARDVTTVPSALLERLFPARVRLELSVPPEPAMLAHYGVREVALDFYSAFDELEERRRAHATFLSELAQVVTPGIERVSVRAPWAAFPGPEPEYYVPSSGGFVRAPAAA